MDSIDEKGKKKKKNPNIILVTHQKILVTKRYTTEIAALQNSVPSPVSILAWAQPIFTGGPEASHN